MYILQVCSLPAEREGEAKTAHEIEQQAAIQKIETMSRSNQNHRQSGMAPLSARDPGQLGLCPRGRKGKAKRQRQRQRQRQTGGLFLSHTKRRFRVGGSERMPNVAQRLACKTSEMEPVICGGNARWSICMTQRNEAPFALAFSHEDLLAEAKSQGGAGAGAGNRKQEAPRPDLVHFCRLVRSEHGCESFGIGADGEPSTEASDCLFTNLWY